MKECAAQRSHMVSSLESVVGCSADLFVLHVPRHHPSGREKQAGQKKHQKLEDVQDLIKIQQPKKKTKNSLLAVMIGHFVSCLVSQNVYHTV